MREPILLAACGKKGVGKSYKTTEIARQYVIGNPAMGTPGRKVLYFDVNNEYSDKTKFPDIRAIALKDLERWSQSPHVEIRRIAPFFDDGKRMTLSDMATVLQWILGKFINGWLIVEDINKYVSDAMPGDLIGSLCTNRHTGCDIMLHYQAVGRLTPKIWQNLTVMRMHRNSESVDRHRNKFEDKYPYLKLAELIVKRRSLAGDIRYFLYVDFDMEKIHTETATMEDIQYAIKTFVAENYNNDLGCSTLLKYRGDNGELLYAPAQAIKMREKELLDLYFDVASPEEDEDQQQL